DIFLWINIDIEYPHAGARAGGDADHRARKYPPPGTDLVLVPGGVLQSMRAKRMFVDEIHRKYRRVASAIIQRRVERPRHFKSSQRSVGKFPQDISAVAR